MVRNNAVEFVLDDVVHEQDDQQAGQKQQRSVDPEIRKAAQRAGIRSGSERA